MISVSSFAFTCAHLIFAQLLSRRIFIHAFLAGISLGQRTHSRRNGMLGRRIEGNNCMPRSLELRPNVQSTEPTKPLLSSNSSVHPTPHTDTHTHRACLGLNPLLSHTYLDAQTLVLSVVSKSAHSCHPAKHKETMDFRSLQRHAHRIITPTETSRPQKRRHAHRIITPT